MSKTLLGAAFVVLLAIAVGGYYFPALHSAVTAGQSPSGSTFQDAKMAQQVVTVGTTTAYAVLNTDSNDRLINSVRIRLSAATATSTTYNIACATSTSASSLQSNTNYILNTSLATTTFGTIVGGGTLVSSSSPGITGTTTASVLVPQGNVFARVWAAGTYLVCQVTTADSFNAFNATTQGFISFPYDPQ